MNAGEIVILFFAFWGLGSIVSLIYGSIFFKKELDDAGAPYKVMFAMACIFESWILLFYMRNL